MSGAGSETHNRRKQIQSLDSGIVVLQAPKACSLLRQPPISAPGM
jgi:hypothetical protein